MLTIPSLVENNKYEFIVINIDIVGSSRLVDLNESDLNIKETKTNLIKSLQAIVNRYPNIPHESGDGVFFLFPVDNLHKDYDTIASLGIILIKYMDSFNDNHIDGNLLSVPISVRIIGHVGQLIFSNSPGSISGDELNIVLKNERDIGKKDYFSISKVFYKNIISKELKRYFIKRDEEMKKEIDSIVEIFDYKPISKSIDNKINDAFVTLKNITDFVSIASYNMQIASLKSRENEISIIINKFGSMMSDQERTNLNNDKQQIKEIKETIESKFEDLWEIPAKDSIKHNLEMADWDFIEKCVTLYDADLDSPHDKHTFYNINDFVEYLVLKSNEMFYAYVPFEKGAALYNDSSEDWVYEELESYEENIKALGWEL